MSGATCSVGHCGDDGNVTRMIINLVKNLGCDNGSDDDHYNYKEMHDDEDKLTIMRIMTRRGRCDDSIWLRMMLNSAMEIIE